MKLKTLLAAIAVAAMTGTAFAADLSITDEVPEPPDPAPSLMGFYVGAALGWNSADIDGSGTASITDDQTCNCAVTWSYDDDHSGSPDDYLLGGFAGYNQQIGVSPLVIGLEASFTGRSNLKGENYRTITEGYYDDTGEQALKVGSNADDVLEWQTGTNGLSLIHI